MASRSCAAGSAIDSGAGTSVGHFAAWFALLILDRDPVGIGCPAAEVDLLAAFRTEGSPRIFWRPDGFPAALRTAHLAYGRQRLQKVILINTCIALFIKGL